MKTTLTSLLRRSRIEYVLRQFKLRGQRDSARPGQGAALPTHLNAPSRDFRQETAQVKRTPQRDLEHKRAQCFIGYFGVNRSLQWTAQNIRRNIAEPLKQAGYQITQAAHFNCPDHFHSPRSGEHHVPATRHYPDLLDIELCWLEPQNTEKLGTLLDDVLRVRWRGEKDSEGIVRRNALLQLYSLRQLGLLLNSLGPARFEIFCLLRADLLYLDPIPAEWIAQQLRHDVDLITPGWTCCGGLNDRFAFCSLRGAQAYLNRIEEVSALCAEKGYFHAETLLQYTAAKEALNLSFTSMRAQRVRATGQVKEEDFSLAEHDKLPAVAL